jgi:protein TonB
MQQRVTSTDNPASLLKTIQHWAPQLVLSIIINLALLKLFLFLIATSEPVATEKSRLHVRLVQNTPQEKILPPKPPEPPKKLVKPKPKPKVVKPQPEKPKPVVKPPPPKRIVKAESPPPPEPDKPEPPREAPTEPVVEEAMVEPEVAEPIQQEPLTTPQPIVSKAPVVAETVPLFRLTRMPKKVYYDLEILERFYPEEERLLGKEATVEAMILVDKNGKIADIDIIKSAGTRFDEAAKKALLSNALVIEPGYIGDKPVATHVRISVPFDLK